MKCLRAGLTSSRSIFPAGFELLPAHDRRDYGLNLTVLANDVGNLFDLFAAIRLEEVDRLVPIHKRIAAIPLNARHLRPKFAPHGIGTLQNIISVLFFSVSS